ncbi:sugar phosphate isomerase/epimerase (plasmid) [Glaciihabitans sp. INWT7]|uniref:sugar phosphate isomerase/epimerase family protein n=1 Tax=Glaciihabitans sp. INWT7 TaxID=2596912 RepID=UPI001628DD89|nr:sugar phosphate isomerase/epimerase family protein [Glaciihabitans sp. INWT7]QNE48643.1 sugar phosphate isomerase/epimerase [Glaciihabitans sp. INWT7]
MVKISFSTLGAPFYTVDQIVQLAEENHYDGVELRTIEGTNDLLSLPDFAPGAVETTRRKFEDAGLAIPCLDTSVLIESGSGEGFDRHLADAKRYATLASELGAPLIRIFAGPPEGVDNPQSFFPDVAKGLAILADVVHDLGVTAAIETHGTLSKSADLLEVFSYGVGENIGVLWDLMHTYRHGESLESSYDGLKSLIKHLHVRDAAGMVAEDKDYVLTGQGIAPLPELIALLEAGNFEGYVSFEWEKFWVPELEEPEVVIPQFAQYMSQFA